MSRHYLTGCTDCGWASRHLRSQAQADYSYRQHSCARQRRRDAARLARVRRRSRIDRTPQPCAHKIAAHQHGTHACYVLDHCRCRPCARASSAYEAQRVRRLAYGRWEPYIDATPSRDHVSALMASGVGLKRVSALSGVSTGVLWKLLYGKRRADGTAVPSARVRSATAQALLALTPGDPVLLAAGARIDATGTRRRLQALIACGWSVSALADTGGIDHQRLRGALAGRDVVTATAAAVRALYDELWDTPPREDDQRSRIAASRSRKRAAAAGWALPLAWDDEAIDDPAAQPAGAHACTAGGCDEPVLARRLCSRHYHAEKRGVVNERRPVEHLAEDVQWLLEQGESPDTVASRLGMALPSLLHRLRRADQRSLVEALTAERSAA